MEIISNLLLHEINALLVLALPLIHCAWRPRAYRSHASYRRVSVDYKLIVNGRSRILEWYFLLRTGPIPRRTRNKLKTAAYLVTISFKSYER